MTKGEMPKECRKRGTRCMVKGAKYRIKTKSLNPVPYTLYLNVINLSSEQHSFVISSEAINLVLLEFKRFLVAKTPRNDRTEFINLMILPCTLYLIPYILYLISYDVLFRHLDFDI